MPRRPDDLRTLVAAGRFRQALYQRLTTVEIVVPPLRKRTEDIPEQAIYFLDRFRRSYGKGARGIASDTMRRLQEHRWPGNVRELSDVIRDGVLRSDGDLLREEDLTILARPLEEEGFGGKRRCKCAVAGCNGTACARRAEGLRREQAARGGVAGNQPVYALPDAGDRKFRGHSAIDAA